MTEKDLVEAYRIVLQNVARWRREALNDPEEFENRDRFLIKLESITLAAIPGRGLVSI